MKKRNRYNRKHVPTKDISPVAQIRPWYDGISWTSVSLTTRQDGLVHRQP